MSFYQLESEEQRIQGLAELRATSLESKSKLVGYCGESQLLELLQVAHSLGIDTGNIPLILVDRHPNSDLAIFSGWKSSPTIPFHKLLFSQL